MKRYLKIDILTGETVAEVESPNAQPKVDSAGLLLVECEGEECARTHRFDPKTKALTPIHGDLREARLAELRRQGLIE